MSGSARLGSRICLGVATAEGAISTKLTQEASAGTPGPSWRVLGVDDGFELVELDAAGASTSVVSPQERKVRGWNHEEWGDELPVDQPLSAAKSEQLDALLLPGSVIHPDRIDIVAVPAHGCDCNLATSRKPDDIPAFNRKMLERFRQRAEPASR